MASALPDELVQRLREGGREGGAGAQGLAAPPAGVAARSDAARDRGDAREPAPAGGRPAAAGERGDGDAAGARGLAATSQVGQPLPGQGGGGAEPPRTA